MNMANNSCELFKKTTPEFDTLAVIKTFVTDISASTGRNDFIFDIWLLHGEL
jgi:hypothetical protein